MLFQRNELASVFDAAKSCVLLQSRVALLGAGVVVMAAAAAGAQPCAPGWSDGFQRPGTAGSQYIGVQTAVAYDEDGPQGPAGRSVVVAGAFREAGGVPVESAAKWTGSSWARIGSGVTQIFQLITFDDGSTGFPRLYAVGMFPTSRVRRHDPISNSWEIPGAGLSTDAGFNSAAVFDAGDGPRLYVGASSNTGEGGASLGGVAQFDGQVWTSAGFPFGWVSVLKVLDLDGPGPEGPTLVAVGDGLFRFDGGVWTPLAPGGFNSAITAVEVFDEDGAGPNPPRLFVGGQFTEVGGVEARGVARWDGSNWTGVGVGAGVSLNHSVTALAVVDDGAGPQLYVGGNFLVAGGAIRPGLVKWTGTQWADSAIGAPLYAGELGGDSQVAVWVMAPIEDDEGPALVIGGKFGIFGNVMSGDVALRRGTRLVALGAGLLREAYGIELHDDGMNPGGSVYLTCPVGSSTSRRSVSRLDEDRWEYVAGAGSPIDARVLHSHTFPGEPRASLIVGGGLLGSNLLSRLDGTSWSAVGGAPNGAVATIASLTLPGRPGPELVVGGQFTTIGGTLLNGIGAYDGAVWRPLGTGVSGTPGPTAVEAVVVFDDGSGGGPRLIAGGSFKLAGGTVANLVASWDGVAWSPMDGLTGSNVSALAVYDDDGEGPNPARLYAGGTFGIDGSPEAQAFARWNGTRWEAPAAVSPPLSVYSLTVHDVDGPGGPTHPVLIVGGDFLAGSAFLGLAAFDGAGWTQLPMTAAASGRPVVRSAVSVPASMHGPARLYVAGYFATVGGVASSNVALLTGCPRCPADFDDSGEVNASDIARFIQVWAASVASGTLGGDFDADHVVTPVDVAAFVKVWLGAVNGGC
ncbi:MAG: hypothetical protein KF745_09615 [Phycisphaeraceae bacterium]|nr:hypothetical protein [Phycisphaeraceae bacterium]